MKIQRMVAGIALLASLVLTANAQQTPPDKKPADLYDTIAAAPNFKTLTKLIDTAGLKDTFKATTDQTQTFTVLAPSDDAFAKVPKGILDKLTNDPKLLRKVLLYHVLTGTLKSTDLTDGLTPKTLQGDTVAVSVKDDGIHVNGAKVTTPDQLAANGVIHTVDIVLIPKGVTGDGTGDGGR